MKALSYLSALAMTLSHKKSIHFAYHEKQETCELVSFGPDPELRDFWLSKHKIACPLCKHTHIVQRIWPKKEPRTSKYFEPFGLTYAEAQEKAKQYILREDK